MTWQAFLSGWMSSHQSDYLCWKNMYSWIKGTWCKVVSIWTESDRGYPNTMLSQSVQKRTTFNIPQANSLIIRRTGSMLKELSSQTYEASMCVGPIMLVLCAHWIFETEFWCPFRSLSGCVLPRAQILSLEEIMTGDTFTDISSEHDASILPWGSQATALIAPLGVK